MGFISEKIYGKKLPALRRSRGFNSADALARKIGKPTGTVQRYEQFEVAGIDPDVLVLIAAALEMSIDAVREEIGAPPDAIPDYQRQAAKPYDGKSGGKKKR